MSRYLLDTNVISAAIRLPQGAVALRLAGTPGPSLCTSILVAAELRYSAARRRSPRLSNSLEKVLSGIEILPLLPPADEAYANLRTRLEASGRSMGAVDLFIAAHAIALDCILVTDDRAFVRVPGLSVENWLL